MNHGTDVSTQYSWHAKTWELRNVVLLLCLVLNTLFAGRTSRVATTPAK